MAKYKITYFFEGIQAAITGTSGVVGWTETWYTPDLTLNLDGILSHVDHANYTRLRRAIMPNIYRISFLRVSDEDNPRVFKVKALTSLFGELQPFGTVPNQFTTQVQCALLADMVRLSGGGSEPTHHRRFLLRALPESVVNGQVINPLSDSWSDVLKFLNFVGQHQTGSAISATPSAIHGLRYHNPATPAPVALSYLQVSGVKGPRFINVQTGAPPVDPFPALAVGKQVTIRDVLPPGQPMNKNWTVVDHIQLTGQSALQLGRSRKDLPSQSFASGQIFQVAWTYNLFSQYTIIGLRTRRTGRVFRQLRGRSSSRR